MQLGSLIYNLFGTSEDLKTTTVSESASSSQKMVLISEGYDCKMNKRAKENILILLTNQVNKKTSSSIYRQMLLNLIPDELIWANNNQETMSKKYTEIIACHGNIYFSMNNFHE